MATLAPDFQRIADSLLDQIKTFDHKVTSRSVGTVSAVYDGVALASGLADVAANELVEFASGVAGIALDLQADSVGIVVMGDYTGIEVGFSSLCVEKEITYRFIDDVLRELAALTPGPYLHIGGDEAHATLDDEYRLFMARVQELVSDQKFSTTGLPAGTYVAEVQGSTGPGEPCPTAVLPAGAHRASHSTAVEVP